MWYNMIVSNAPCSRGQHPDLLRCPHSLPSTNFPSLWPRAAARGTNCPGLFTQVASLSFQQLPHCPVCKPFVLTFIQHAGGVYPPHCSNAQTFRRATFRRFSIFFRCNTYKKTGGRGLPVASATFRKRAGILVPHSLTCSTHSLPGDSATVSEKAKGAKLFPLFLKLVGRPCLVVGAGAIAESKIASLVEAGARVRVVAPEATKQVRSWAQSGKVDWQARPFQIGDLDNMFLVVAATSSTELHEQIFAEARRRGVLCNVVDVPALCDFYYPAVVQRGALQIAISTAGLSPALAQRLRQQLETQFGAEYAAWLEHLGEAREKLLRASMEPEERKGRLHELASEAAFQAFRRKRRSAKSKSSGAKAPKKRRG